MIFLLSFIYMLVFSAAPLVSAQAPYEGYVFAYFTGNSVEGENIYLAASNGNNALNWTDLNDGQPVLKSTQGTTGLRDPFLMRSQEGDGFFLIATDLSIGSGTSWGDAVKFGSRYIEVWESRDLKTWSEQRHVLVSPPEAGNTWAPEAYFDKAIGEYVVFWASSLYDTDDVDRTGATYHRMLYATTKDFITFSSTKVWQEAGKSRNDSTVIEVDDTFYRFTKDEGAGGTGCSDIIQESSTSLLASLDSWTSITSCIGRKAGLSAVEGPIVFKSNPEDVNGDRFYLFVDEYGGRGYVPLETANIASPDWKVSIAYRLPSTPRHGTVVSLTATELVTLSETMSAKFPSAGMRHRRSEMLAPRATSGSPILPGLYADPNIAVFNDTYYIYATTDGYPEWGGTEFFVWKSSDLVNWSRSTSPILKLNDTSGNVPWAVGNAWAPTIIARDGRYFFYFSGQNPELGRKTIGVASASSPDGPFMAATSPMILNNEAITTDQAIDPDAFQDPQTGIHWLIWGNGTPLMAQLSDDMLSIKADTIQRISGLVDFREACFMIYRKGLYHFTYSIDDTGSENYRVGYATGNAITGPWTYHGIVLQKNSTLDILATGHNSIINVPDTDDWYIAYHRFNRPGGDGTHRETCIDRLFFDATSGLIKPVIPTLQGVEPQSISTSS